jgi:hypothetical protein
MGRLRVQQLLLFRAHEKRAAGFPWNSPARKRSGWPRSRYAHSICGTTGIASCSAVPDSAGRAPRARRKRSTGKPAAELRSTGARSPKMKCPVVHPANNPHTVFPSPQAGKGPNENKGVAHCVFEGAEYPKGTSSDLRRVRSVKHPPSRSSFSRCCMKRVVRAGVKLLKRHRSTMTHPMARRPGPISSFGTSLSSTQRAYRHIARRMRISRTDQTTCSAVSSVDTCTRVFISRSDLRGMPALPRLHLVSTVEVTCLSKWKEARTSERRADKTIWIALMPTCEPKSESPGQGAANLAAPVRCSCGGQLILAGYGLVSRKGFWMEQKCIGCKMKSVVVRGYGARTF